MPSPTVISGPPHVFTLSAHRLGCCARAASGHATAAPPSAANNSRRPMVTVMRPSRAPILVATISQVLGGVGDGAAADLGELADCAHRRVWMSPERGDGALARAVR